MKHVIVKFFQKGSRISEKDLQCLDFDFTQLYAGGLQINEHVEEDDGASVNTVSTNATADDIPGPGRTIDKYIYQFLGRKIERFANRFSMSRLPPARIAQCLYAGPYWWQFISDTEQLGSIIVDIHYEDSLPCEGGAVVAGLKSLVRQTQSDSIYRSAAALAALIHLSFSNDRYYQFVLSVGEVEPLFHLEALANALDDSNTEKKCLAALITLAREQVYGRRQERLTTARVEKLRRRLIGLLDLYRVQCLGDDPRSGSPNYCFLSILGSACILCNECYHFNIRDEPDNISNVESLFETLFFLTILLIHCITSLYRQMNHKGMKLEHMISSAYIHWIQTIPLYYTRADVSSLSRHASMIASVHDCILVRYPNYERLDECCHYFLPRKMRSAILEGKNTAVYDQQIQACMPRTRRLISSFSELDREARDSALIAKRRARYSTWNGQSIKSYSDQELHRTRERALEYIAREMGISVDVVRTLEVSYDGTPWFVHDSTGRVYASEHDLNWDLVHSAVDNTIHEWRHIKYTRRNRREWGEYLRSNLEWDWDTASCLKSLFKEPKPAVRNSAPQQEHSQSTTFAGEPGGRELNVTIDARNSSPPDVVKVQYVNEAGERKYKRFITCPSTESLALGGEGNPSLVGEVGIAAMSTEASSLEIECDIASGGTESDGGPEGTNDDIESENLEVEAERILGNHTDGGVPLSFFSLKSSKRPSSEFETSAFIEEMTSRAETQTLPIGDDGRMLFVEHAVGEIAGVGNQECKVEEAGFTVVRINECLDDEDKTMGVTEADQISICSLD